MSGDEALQLKPYGVGEDYLEFSPVAVALDGRRLRIAFNDYDPELAAILKTISEHWSEVVLAFSEENAKGVRASIVEVDKRLG